MATGTLTPWPRYTVLNAAGAPISGALLYTYIAGTSTPQATYSDVGLTTPNANPIVANSSGQVGPVFLSPGASYKFVFQKPDGSSLFSQDNIAAVPGTSAGVDVTGTAGEALTAGQAVYLSAGDGGKTAGLWYKSDSANTYSSTTNMVGMVPAAISAGSSGAIRLSGLVTGLSSLTVGTLYYVGTAGAVTATAPANSRLLGQADTTSSIVLSADPPPRVVTTDNAVVDGRLTLTTSVPVTTADVTAATTLFFTPYRGYLVALYDGTNWNLVSFTEISIAVPATTSQMYDVFVYSNSGTATLELLAWTNDTTRATALVTQNGVLSKTGALTRRYLGSFRTTTVSGQTEDSFAKRYLWNYYNRMLRVMRVKETTDSWTYTINTFQQARGAPANQLDFVLGVAEVPVSAEVVSNATGGAGVTIWVAIGEDSTSTADANCLVGTAWTNNAAADILGPRASLKKYPAVGRHFWPWLEKSVASSVTTWYGDNGSDGTQSGIQGDYLG